MLLSDKLHPYFLKDDVEARKIAYFKIARLQHGYKLRSHYQYGNKRSYWTLEMPHLNEEFLQTCHDEELALREVMRRNNFFTPEKMKKKVM